MKLIRIKNIPPLLCICLFLLSSINVKAQSSDTTELSEEPDTLHSVTKATLLSAAFPGLGQVYNRKYWKLPIIYGGLGATTFFIIDNHRQYKNFLNAFYTRTDDDSLTVDNYEGVYNERQLIELQNIYRKWRDLSIIITGVIYALNIIDAHVDAHLYYYNVDENLSLRWQPAVIKSGWSHSVGVNLKLYLR